jgi:predicted Zn-dependent protease
MKNCIGIAITILLAVPAAAQDVIRVYMAPPIANAEGFVDDALKGQQDSFADLAERLRRNKAFDVVEDAARADIAVEIRGRGWKNTGATSTTTTQMPTIAGGGLSSTTTPDRTKEVTIVLKAGSYEKEFSARNDQVFGAWKAIAGRLSNDIEKWVRENRAQLMARRRQ